MGNLLKLINLHFFSLNFCSRKQKYLEKRVTFKYSMSSVNLSDMNRHRMCINFFFEHPYYWKLHKINKFTLSFRPFFLEAKITGELKYSQVFYVFCHPEEV